MTNLSGMGGLPHTEGTGLTWPFSRNLLSSSSSILDFRYFNKPIVPRAIISLLMDFIGFPSTWRDFKWGNVPKKENNWSWSYCFLNSNFTKFQLLQKTKSCTISRNYWFCNKNIVGVIFYSDSQKAAGYNSFKNELVTFLRHGFLPSVKGSVDKSLLLKSNLSRLCKLITSSGNTGILLSLKSSNFTFGIFSKSMSVSSSMKLNPT